MKWGASYPARMGLLQFHAPFNSSEVLKFFISWEHGLRVARAAGKCGNASPRSQPSCRQNQAILFHLFPPNVP